MGNNNTYSNTTTNLQIIIAGGGTGGHIFPAVAIANAIKEFRPNAEFLFVGAKGKMEMEKVPQAGFNIEGLDIAGFNRSAIWKNVSLPYKLIKSFLQVKNIFKKFTPDCVIGVGGYSTFPVLRYAQSKGIPTFIHESNSFAGKANIMLAKKVTKAYVASEGMEQFFPKEKIVITGNPIRKDILTSTVDKTTATAFFKLTPTKKTILSIGGSLGAKSINEALASNIEFFEKNNVQLIWQTGKPFAETAKAAVQGKTNIYTNDFIKEMHYAFGAADIVISRAGAMSIAELCAVGKPAVFVPFPYAAEDHQTANATYLVNKQAGILVKDSDAKEKLILEIESLLKDEDKQKYMATAIKKLGVTNAAEKVAENILTTINK